MSDGKSKKTLYRISNDFYDVSSKRFVDSLNYNIYREFFVDAMNKAMVPLFKETFGKSRLLSVDNKKISYNLDNLNIYINKSLKEIMQINTDVTGQVAKVIIKHSDDEIYYFDLKIHYAYLELAHNNHKVNKVSEILDGKAKVKRL